MELKPGTVLMSTALLNGSYFEQAMIFIAEKNINGAMGFVINKKFTRVLNELAEFSYTKAFPLYSGGPVKDESIFFIHRLPALAVGATAIQGNIFLGGNFKEAVRLITNNSINADDIKIFIGYCGWDAGELEAEIDEGSWQVLSHSTPAFSPFMQ